jgi:hypothetical protein
VTLSITKKPGENAIDVADAVMRRVDELRNTLIPRACRWPRAQLRRHRQRQGDEADPEADVRHRGGGGVVFALGRREAAIVGAA